MNDPKRDKDSICIYLQLPGKHRGPAVSPSRQSDQTLTSLVKCLNKITSNVSKDNQRLLTSKSIPIKVRLLIYKVGYMYLSIVKPVLGGHSKIDKTKVLYDKW